MVITVRKQFMKKKFDLETISILSKALKT